MRKIQLTVTTLCLLAWHGSIAQWNTNPAENTAICSTPPTQASRSQIKTVSDGNNGMFVCWIDGRTVSGGSVYVQRVTNTNTGLFTANGLLVSGTTVSKGNLGMTSDGAGGVIISWQENNDIFAQRVSANGNLLWSGDKLLSVTTAGTQSGPVVAAVNSNHAIAAFVDSRNSAASGNDIYIQKIDLATGNRLLTIDTPACKATGNQTAIQIVADGSGGAYVAWQDPRVASTDINIYSMRVDNDCLPVSGWTINGNPVCTATGNQTGLVMISDRNNGVYATWADFRAGSTNGDIYAQRIGLDGSPVWATNGVPVNTNFGSQAFPQILAVNDGAILTWTDPRLGTSDRNIFAQKISLAAGDSLWTAGGVKICDATGNQPSSTSDGLAITSDGNNGAIILWNDTRSSATSGNDIYAQKINASGVVQWENNGLLVCNAPGNQGSVVSVEYIAATNGVLACWQDSRSGTSPSNGEIYGAHISSDGNLTNSLRNTPGLAGTIKAYPIPAQNEITLSLNGVKPGNYLMQVTDISGRVLLQRKTVLNGNSGLIQTNVQQLFSGMYFIRLMHEETKAASVYPFMKQ